MDGNRPAITETTRASPIQIGMSAYEITTTQPASADTRVDDAHAERRAEQPAQHADEEGLEQELRGDLGAAVADGPADPDLRRSVGSPRST